MTQSIRTIVIPAAGQGTRLLPATKVTPKELLQVYDRPVLQFAIDEAISAKAERIVVVIHPTKMAIRDYLTPDDAYIEELRQSGKADLGAALSALQLPEDVELLFAFQNRPLGLGHAVLCAKELTLPGPFGVLLPDDIIMGKPCLPEMARSYRSGHMVAAMEVLPQDASQYGIFNGLGAAKGRSIPATGMVEKPAPGTEPSLLAAVGRYILDPAIFSTLEGLSGAAGGEIQLTDAIARDGACMPLTAFRFSGKRFDCGNHDGLLGAAVARQAEVKRRRIAAPGAAPSAAPSIRSGDVAPSMASK